MAAISTGDVWIHHLNFKQIIVNFLFKHSAGQNKDSKYGIKDVYEEKAGDQSKTLCQISSRRTGLLLTLLVHVVGAEVVDAPVGDEVDPSITQVPDIPQEVLEAAAGIYFECFDSQSMPNVRKESWNILYRKFKLNYKS